MSMNKKIMGTGLLVFFLLSAAAVPAIGDGVAEKNGKISGSVITRTLNDMLNSYYTELALLRTEVKGLSDDSKGYVEWLLDDVEDSLKNVEFYYSDGQYQKMNEELKKIEDGLLKAKREIALIKLISEERGRGGSAVVYNPIFLLLYLIIIAGLYILVKIFILGKQRLKVGKTDLVLIDRQVKREIDQERIPLRRRIEKLEKRVKDIGYKKWRVEIELIKEKYRQGLLGMCEDYLDELERELKGKGK
jgi:hypothetical protein